MSSSEDEAEDPTFASSMNHVLEDDPHMLMNEQNEGTMRKSPEYHGRTGNYTTGHTLKAH